MRVLRSMMLAASTVAVTLVPVSTPEAGAQTGSNIPWWVTQDEANLIIWLNSQRNWYGPSSLIVDPDLTLAARAQAQALANCGCLYHQQLSFLFGRGWTSAGENVAYAGSTWGAHVALSYSSPHLRNMINPGYKGVGVGVAVANGTVYVAQVFGGF